MTSFEYLIAVGSNLGDRRRHIQLALDALAARGVKITRISTLRETVPVGMADQIFVNGAFACVSDLPPEDMMRTLLAVEESLGRQRDLKWGNRTIDLDILQIRDGRGEAVIKSSEFLTVPHPRMWERDFVMIPAQEVWSFDQSDKRRLGVTKSDALWLAGILLVTLLVRLFFAASIPFGNDEAYYWDWSRIPQLSYFDHPPMVAIFAWLSSVVIGSENVLLAGRLFVPLSFFASSILLLKILTLVKGQRLSRTESLGFVAATQLIPAFSLGGIMLLPDAGLILFSTLAVWFVLKWHATSHLKSWQGAAIGLAFGLAGLSKYHAAVMAAGVLGYLIFLRRRRVSSELGFWVLLVVCGLLAVSPVIFWNAEHGWVSFLFQGSRGLGGRGFAIVPALRTVLGELVFLGPLFVLGALRAWRRKSYFLQSAEFRLLMAAALPLLVILKLFSFTSQTLPHWTMPSFWLLLPAVVLSLEGIAKTAWRVSTAYGLLFCLLVPALLASRAGRQAVIAAMNERPAGLGEMTLWDEASRDDKFLHYIKDHSWITDIVPEACGADVVYAAPRWFTVAQTAANLPWHPIVETLDPKHLSYYHLRPQRAAWTGCPTVVLSERSHYGSVEASPVFKLFEAKEFEIRGHRDRPIVVARGYKLAPTTKHNQ